MNVNKKLDRFKQWAGERMGAEVKTGVSDDFRTLELEMGVRQEGLKENQKAIGAYVKALSKRSEGDEKDKILPVAALGVAMNSYGENFENDSQFGQSLIAMGRTHERLARTQESYIAKANTTWVESLERSNAQMKEYQAARKKLETRRLAYDTALAKMHKAKKEDYRCEEELRSQKAKYEESSEDVYRRMQDIKEAEVDSVTDLKDFLDAELNYHQRCYEVLLQLQRDWPTSEELDRRPSRPRSNTAHSYAERYQAAEEEREAPRQPERPWARLARVTSASSQQSLPRETGTRDYGHSRPQIGRSTTFDDRPRHGDMSPAYSAGMARVASDSVNIQAQRSQLRSVSRLRTDGLDETSDASTYYTNSSSNSPDRYFGDRPASPATSHGSAASRNVSYGALGGASGKKPPPPPPPSRAKKPPPPPPPPSRRIVSAGNYYGS